MVTVRRMPYPSDLTDDQWDLLEPVFNAPSKRGRKHAENLRSVAKSFENSDSSATGWLQVACIATTLRHLSRERARRRPVALAA